MVQTQSAMVRRDLRKVLPPLDLKSIHNQMKARTARKSYHMSPKTKYSSLGMTGE